MTARFTLPAGRPTAGRSPYRTVVGYRTRADDRRHRTGRLRRLPTTDCETGDDAAPAADTRPRDPARRRGRRSPPASTGEVPFRAVFAGADAPTSSTSRSARTAGAGLRRRRRSETRSRPGGRQRDAARAWRRRPGRRGARPPPRPADRTARQRAGAIRRGDVRRVAAAGDAARRREERRGRAASRGPRSPPRRRRRADALAVATPSRTCVSRRTVASACADAAEGPAAVRSVRVNGRRVRSAPAGRTRLLVDLRGLPRSSAYAIRIAARLADGTRVRRPAPLPDLHAEGRALRAAARHRPSGG